MKTYDRVREGHRVVISLLLKLKKLVYIQVILIPKPLYTIHIRNLKLVRLGKQSWSKNQIGTVHPKLKIMETKS